MTWGTHWFKCSAALKIQHLRCYDLNYLHRRENSLVHAGSMSVGTMWLLVGCGGKWVGVFQVDFSCEQWVQKCPQNTHTHTFIKRHRFFRISIGRLLHVVSTVRFCIYFHFNFALSTSNSRTRKWSKWFFFLLFKIELWFVPCFS